MIAARRAAGAGSGKDDAAQKWLNEQKLKLVASKQAERQAEMEQYKAEKVCMPFVFRSYGDTETHIKDVGGMATYSISDYGLLLLVFCVWGVLGG